ncbi:GNAT family N-acetyltransferase [Streptomyces sp. NPDC050147]|uniref:GNAT family N-acetyltransferase n=1 Tax=Streptomyces sp. NPDC050147 TaxID=3155513 RepID=UPI00341C7D48
MSTLLLPLFGCELSKAFGRKLGSALGPPEKGRAFLAAHLHHDRGITALDGAGRVIGVAGYDLAGRALNGGSARDVLSKYGPLRGPLRLALLVLLTRKPAEGELVMDGICVAAAHRGAGIGALLLREIAAVGAENACRRIRLDVIDVNPRAKALYERHGFSAVRTQQTPFLRRLMGFGAVTTMHRAVTPDDLTGGSPR